MENKIIFIDVDGPLSWATWNEGSLKINKGDKDEFKIPYPWLKEEVKALNEIIDKTGAKLVVSSDWRLHFSFNQMGDIFRHYDLGPWNLLDFTTMASQWKKLSRPSQSWERAAQILKYVKDNKIQRWIAIDDLDLASQFKYMKVPKYRHIQTRGDHGGKDKLSEKIELAIKILNK